MLRRLAVSLLTAALAVAVMASAEEAAPGLLRRADAHHYPGLDREHEAKWRAPFFFIQLSDTQFGMFEKDKSWEKETERFEKAVAHINRLKPRFVIVTGDLVNQGPGGAVHTQEVSEFEQIAKKIDPSIPLICVPGNHDVGNRPTAGLLKAWRRDFGDDRFSFWAGGVFCVVLDSSLYYDPSGAPEEQQQQDQWLREQLATAKVQYPKHMLVFQHHPWFLKDAAEADQYFNIPLERRRPALDLFHSVGVRAVFAGHLHKNAHGTDGDLEMVTTSACGMPLGKDPSGLRIVKVYGNRLEHEFYGLDAVPEKVSLD